MAIYTLTVRLKKNNDLLSWSLDSYASCRIMLDVLFRHFDIDSANICGTDERPLVTMGV